MIPAPPVINCEIALARLGRDEQLLARLAEFFLEDGPALMSEIDTAIGLQDLEATTQAAHSLKGMVANFEAVAAMAAARQLESLQQDGTLDGCQPLVERLRIEIERVIEALKVLLFGRNVSS